MLLVKNARLEKEGRLRIGDEGRRMLKGKKARLRKS